MTEHGDRGRHHCLPLSDETDRHAKAYALWEKEGRPEGRDGDYWH
ncbi:DUF2934 domain-containing protein [Agrobacterium vitis]|nr:DUF2934 domain-containing protein [Agrobacterium vitis]